ncbi:HAD family hydrolase [Novosphingobium sp. B 225]|uniref:HAD family hydrolase n=1 Tax=Novosphingobium sp. B 225 TaxID=1961849 RepID=UPI000B4AEADA|nr:HAD family phosphatase [Novosphingobium sp. B 225]
MIEAVVFDVGNVLVRWDRRLPYLDRFADPAELDHFMEQVIPLSWHAEHDAGRPAAELVAERSALFPHYADLIHDWFAKFNLSIPGPVPGSPELVEALHARGVPLYAITNFGADTWAGFRPTFPLADRFRDIVVSGVEQLAKPDPAIYALAQARFGHDPQAMLFIDDSLPNVISARECGWHAHHFADAAGLETELRSRGLL